MMLRYQMLVYVIIVGLSGMSQIGCRVPKPRSAVSNGQVVDRAQSQAPSTVNSQVPPDAPADQPLLVIGDADRDVSSTALNDPYQAYCTDYWSQHNIDSAQVARPATGAALRIGLILPKSGPLVGVASQLDRGAKAAAQSSELTVDVIEVDFQNTAEIKTALCGSYLDALVGPLDREGVIELGKHTAGKMPVVHFSRKFSSLEKSARQLNVDGRLVDVMQTIEDRGQALVSAWRDHKTTAGIEAGAASLIYVQSTYGDSMAAVLRSALGSDLVFDRPVHADLSNLDGVVAGLASGSSESIFIVSDVDLLRQILPRMVRAGVSPSSNGKAIKGRAIRLFATADGLTTAGLRPTDIRYLDGAILVPGYYPDTIGQSDILGPFSQALGHMPTLLEAVGFDALQLAIRLATSRQLEAGYVGLTATYTVSNEQLRVQPAAYQVRSNRIERMIEKLEL